MSHTPGPWTYSGQSGIPKHCFVAQVWRPDGGVLADIEPTEQEEEATANARLIATAPELLAVLEWLLPILKTQPKPDFGGWNWPSMADDVQSVITKAKGFSE